jgi:hypothetical protein
MRRAPLPPPERSAPHVSGRAIRGLYPRCLGEFSGTAMGDWRFAAFASGVLRRIAVEYHEAFDQKPVAVDNKCSERPLRNWSEHIWQ